MMLKSKLLIIFLVVLFVTIKTVIAQRPLKERYVFIEDSDPVESFYERATINPPPAPSSAVSRLPYCPNSESCKLPGARIGSKSYYLGVHVKLNWYEAHLYCRRYCMQLLTLSTKSENDDIVRYLTNQGVPLSRFWTSGVDLNEEGRYYWMATGQLFNFTNWDPVQPDNANGVEHCIELVGTERGRYYWNDYPCYQKLNFICEA